MRSKRSRKEAAWDIGLWAVSRLLFATALLAILCSPLWAQQQVQIVSGALAIPASPGHTSFRVLLNQNVTSFSISNPIGSEGLSIEVLMVQDSTGSRTVTGYASNIVNTGVINVSGTANATTPLGFSYDSASNQWVVTSGGGSAVIPNPLSTVAIQDKGGQVFNVKAYGAKGDGVTDDTAAVNAAISAANAAHGGTIYFPPATYLIAGQIVFPNDGTGSGAVYAKQPSFELKGAGNMENGQGFPVSGNLGGSVLNMTYSTASSPAAKIETFGVGLLTIRDLTLEDTSGDSTQFILTTGTTLHIYDNAFIGSKSSTANNQDVLLLGGTNTTESNSNDPNAAFQGYGTIIRGNYFNHIRHAMYGQTYVAHVVFSDNFIGPGTGSNQTNDAPVVLDGSATGANTVDNVISQNRCEIVGYYYCFKAISSQSNYFAGNDVEDAQSAFNTAIFDFDAASLDNLVINNVAPSGGNLTAHVIDASNSAIVLDSGAGSPNSFGSGRQINLAPNIYTDTAGNLNAQQTTAATSGANHQSPNVVVGGTYWNGSASANDTWTLFDSLGSGTNPVATLEFSHAGTTGTHLLNLAGQSGDNQVYFAGSSHFDSAGALTVSGGNFTLTGGDEYLQNGHNLWVRNTTAATSGANQSSNYSYIAGQYWNGSASALDYWQLQDALGSGANPTSTLTWTHSGSTGASKISFPGNVAYPPLNVTATVGTTAVSANTCVAQTAITMTGLATTMTLDFTATSDTSTVTGWGSPSAGLLYITDYPTANTVNWSVCNATASSITPSASVTFNVSAK